MGLTGELVKSVFSRSRPSGPHTTNTRSGMAERSRWSAMRSYLCGDEFNSVLAEKDSASVKSFEATTSPSFIETEPDIERNGEKESFSEKQRNSMSRLFHEDDAAIIIQSAFRRFLARRRGMEDISVSRREQCATSAAESPREDSIGTSLEVQTGNSLQVFAAQDEKLTISHQKHKFRTQVSKPKEEWDDSKVSSNISKMRIQSRLEATTRRERAMAYAFSQQLRICSKKRQTRTEGREPNMSWSWLERWMATRVPESPLVGNHVNMQPRPSNTVKKNLLDVGGEENESCGSNKVSAHLYALTVGTAGDGKNLKPTRNRPKATSKRSISRRKTVPSQHCPKAFAKLSREDSSDDIGTVTERKHKQQMESKDKTKCDHPES